MQIQENLVLWWLPKIKVFWQASSISLCRWKSPKEKGFPPATNTISRVSSRLEKLFKCMFRSINQAKANFSPENDEAGKLQYVPLSLWVNYGHPLLRIMLLFSISCCTTTTTIWCYKTTHNGMSTAECWPIYSLIPPLFTFVYMPSYSEIAQNSSITLMIWMIHGAKM